MSSNGSRPTTRSARFGVRSRRDLVHRPRRGLTDLLEAVLRVPALGWGLVIWVAFTLACGSLAVWSRRQPLVAVGRIANETVISRVPLRVEDSEQTRQHRALAERLTPRVYDANLSVIESIRTSIENLPRALASVERADELAPDVSEQFPGLDEPAIGAIRAEWQNGQVSEEWKRRTAVFVDALLRRPIVTPDTYQSEATEGAREVELRIGDAPSLLVPSTNLVNLADERQLTEMVREQARRAGFVDPALRVIAARVAARPLPTFTFAPLATQERKRAAAEAVLPVIRTIEPGAVLLARGTPVTETALEWYRQELQTYQATAAPWRVWLRVLSVFGAVGTVAGAAAGYLAVFAPGLARQPLRTAQIAALLMGMMGLACAGTVLAPGLITLTAVAPTVFVAAVAAVALGRRVALALSALHGVLVAIALDLPIGTYALMLTGVAVAVIRLHEIQDRRTIIGMGLQSGLALALGTVLVALIDRPIHQAVLRETLLDAALAGLGGVSVGVVILAIVPAIERLFDVVTGLTLIELRDPRHPLLRQLQQRAPGTYNHSLNVASIAEAAAHAIGANALLTYVGALYHDIGKMNKPEYFAENQGPGPSRHDRLSPAMSLLVIVGHVKDGMAMAEEYNLPGAVRHFIEAHHGTTLVEFFYDRARRAAARRAAGGDPALEAPEETEYRYPGPKPRTREAAVVMLADAVESATRTLSEPTPSRIEALVRALANKRLMDGQFDECELTLRDLHAIVESISRTVATIYHGRVQYPEAPVPGQAASPTRERA